MNQILDLAKLREANVDTEFFPCCQIDCIIQKNALASVLREFPETNIRGSIPPHRLTYGANFKKLVDELYDDELRSLIAEKFDIDLSTSHTMLTIRGQTNHKDGFIHTDTRSKLVTVLLYLNEDWSEPTGNLRLLRDGSSLENYFAEITPTAGKFLVFKVTDNCWHGHYPFVGKRHTLQLNYVTDQSVVNREMKRHSRSYTLKKISHLIKT